MWPLSYRRIIHLAQLQERCGRCEIDAQIEACVAAADLCGGTYPDPTRHWFDAVQDLLAMHRELRRQDNTIAGWARVDGEFFDRLNFAIRRWEERIAQPEENDMATTTKSARRKVARKRRVTRPAGVPETQEQAAAKEAEACRTFNAWRAELVQALQWSEQDARKRNDELLEAYHNNETVASALVHFAVNPLPRETSAPPRETHGSAGETIHEIPVTAIAPAPWNPRQDFDAAALQELADSLKKVGLLQPIVVRREADGYELVAGERRWRAAKRAKLQTIGCRVVDITDEEAKEACVMENLRRQDLNPIEHARSVQLLIDGCGLTQAAAAKRLGYKNASQVANELFLLELPEAWQQRVISQEISPTHTRHLRAWLKRENVLERIGQQLDDHLSPARGPGRSPTAKEFQEMVQRAAWKLSRTLVKTGWGESCEFSVTPKRRKELDLQKVPQQWAGSPILRAFNVKLWNQLNKDVQQKRKATADHAAAGTGKTTRTQRKAAAAAPDRWEIETRKIGWYQTAIAGRLQTAAWDQVLRVMVMVCQRWSWPEEGVTALAETLQGGEGCARLSEGQLWRLLEPPDQQTLEQAVRAGVCQALAAGAEDGCNPDSIDDLLALRAMAEWLGVDWSREWAPRTGDLAGYSDKRLRKMPPAKEAPAEHTGEDLQNWLTLRWQPGEYIPREFAEPQPTGDR